MHAGQVDLEASSRPARPDVGGGPVLPWPASLVERALGLIEADYRRPAGPLVMVAVLGLAAVFESSKEAGPLGYSLVLPLSLLGILPLALARRLPRLAITAVLLANSFFVVFGRLSWPAAAVAGWLIALTASAVLLPRRLALAAITLTEIAVLLGSLDLGGNVTPWDATAAEALSAVVAWGAGQMLRARRQSAIEHAAAATQVRELNERDAAARERASIARELHDVVAHHVSMIAVRAATAPYAMPGLPEPGQAAFAEIAEEARTALAELRVALGVLRSPAAGGEAAPQPGIADVPELLAKVASIGTKGVLSVTGAPRDLPRAVGLCCYRVIQEALTNAGRHAPGGDARVEIHYQGENVGVRVSSCPPASRPPADSAGPGFGLVGLRERVQLLGGEFSAGGDGASGFTVTAVLPCPPAPAGLPAAPAPPAPPAAAGERS